MDQADGPKDTNRGARRMPVHNSIQNSQSKLHPPSSNERSMPNTTPWLGLAIAGTTMVSMLALTAPFVLQYIRSPLPYMATPKDKVRRALEFVANRRRQQPTTRQCHTNAAAIVPPVRHFVDMGSGDGEAVYQALLQPAYSSPDKLQQPNMTHNHHLYATATGIELNSTLWAFSQVRRLFRWKREERKRSSFLCQNMFAYNLQHSDTVMIFGVKPLMASISQKLAQECQDGTFVLAYRFPIPLADNIISKENDQRRREGKPDETATSEHVEAEPSTPSTPSDELLSAELVYEEEEMRIYECRKG